MKQIESKLSHLNQAGEAVMVDTSGKAVSRRNAVAAATVVMSLDAIAQLVAGNNKKGDVLGVARVAGIQAAKKCSELIPLCHPLPLQAVRVEFTVDQRRGAVDIRAECKVDGKTGVEMEALTAASIAALTIYDMCKAVDKGIVISDLRLLEKRGGKSGDWRAEGGISENSISGEPE